MDCNQALKRITKQVETLTAAVDQHSDYLTVHEKRLIRIEKFLDGATLNNKLFKAPATADDLDKEPSAVQPKPAPDKRMPPAGNPDVRESIPVPPH